MASPAPEQATRTVVVFVPGVTGTQLEDPASGKIVWGGGSQLVRPRDGGYGLVLPLDAAEDLGARRQHPQAAFVPSAPLWQLRLLGFKKPIYKPLADEFTRRGFQRGDLKASRPNDRFFFFLYDWRYGVVTSARELDRQLRALTQARGSPTAGERPEAGAEDDAGRAAGLEVDLVCQSNASKICRYVDKYGGATLEQAELGEGATDRPYTVRKLVLVGASNGGAVRSLRQLHKGRRYVPGIGRRLLPETVFSVRSLFDDLPSPRPDLFLDGEGRPVEVDLYDAASWARYRISIFRRDAEERLAERGREDLFGTLSERLRFLEQRLDGARRLQRLLLLDPPAAGESRIYLLENGSQPTMQRALLLRRKTEWQLLFGDDGGAAKRPNLRARLLVSGDGHATLDSQRALSKGELSRIAGSRRLTGGHFEMLIAPEALSALFELLAD